MPTGSFASESVHEPSPADSEIMHSVAVESFTVTIPVGVEPANSGRTATESCSAPSSPRFTLGAERSSAIVDADLPTVIRVGVSVVLVPKLLPL